MSNAHMLDAPILYIPACTYQTFFFTSNCHNFLQQFVFLKHLSWWSNWHFKRWMCSYVLQVGQSDCEDRLRYLADKYSFRCQCRGCSQLNLSDLVLNAFCCVNHNCAGVVLESTIINGETRKLNNFPRAPEKQKFDSHLQVCFVFFIKSRDSIRCITDCWIPEI